MDTFELLRRLYVAGANVTLTDHGTFTLAGRRISGDLHAAVVAAKPAIIATLIDQGIGVRDPGYRHVRQYVVPPDCMAGNACQHVGPCSQFLMRHPCAPSEHLESSDDGKAA